MTTAVDIRSVTVKFANDVTALSNVNINIPHGQFVSIVGPSGCGKTTLLNLVAGLFDEPHSGDVSILGDSPKISNPNVAYMFARDCLLPWRTALGNASYGMELRGIDKETTQSKAMSILASVGLRGFEESLPKALSHGMRQRVALARTFALDSPILLMDEPFGALDAQTKIVLADVLMSLWQKERRTVLFITHDLAEAIALSDRVIVMSARPGRIVKDVTVDLSRPRSSRALQNEPRFHELYTELWNSLEL
ncbi:ABC transporter ATP-binding protein [Pusillimonas sp.]|uniref:ABC transporter ATP-binding protein n=1 Tax=Pusillimonas sp. TaxID=3040095 RepID=UPI0037C8C99C